jgi:hypothetical protein
MLIYLGLIFKYLYKFELLYNVYLIDFKKRKNIIFKGSNSIFLVKTIVFISLIRFYENLVNITH